VAEKPAASKITTANSIAAIDAINQQSAAAKESGDGCVPLVEAASLVHPAGKTGECKLHFRCVAPLPSTTLPTPFHG
jgi:hypothetical protein